MSTLRAPLETLSKSLHADLSHADKHVQELEQWKERPPAGYEAHAAALLLHHLYGAIEAMVERSLKMFDGVSPSGASSHVEILELAVREVEGVRPAILPADAAIDELRRFRHRFRKRYDVDLEPQLLQPVIRRAVDAWPRIRPTLAAFAAFVDACAEAAQ